MNVKNSITFFKVTAPVEFSFQNGLICCEWCDKSDRNRKGHYECCITHEEMVEPGRNIGFYCPAREAIEEKERENEACQQH